MGLGLDISGMAEFSAKLDGISRSLEGIRKAQLHDQIMRGHPASWVSVLPSLAAQPTQLTGLTDLTAETGPIGGMVWEIRRMTFGLPVGGTASGGTLIVYREGVEVARTTTIPNFLTFSGYELILQPNEDLQACWYGGTANAQLVVDIMAVEYPVAGVVEVET